jgi:hypothetical protein
VALDPHEIVSDVAQRARRIAADRPPGLLRHPPGAGTPLPSVHHGQELATVHHGWASVHDDETEGAGEGRRGGSRMWARVRAHVVAAALPAQRADRALIGDLIRAVDALGQRVDEVGTRLVFLEELVEELVVVTSDDITRIRAAIAADIEQDGPAGPPKVGPPAGD